MKLTKEQETKLAEMAFAEISNKEIAKELGIDLSDVHAARSRLGITIPKVKQSLERGYNPNTRIRTLEEVEQEIEKVAKAKIAANKKLERCDERLLELLKELQLHLTKTERR